MMKIKRITGVMWASDILTGQKPFPYMQSDKKPATAAGQDGGADFAALLDKATAKLNTRHGAAG